jgi:hypothetical protein
VDFLNDIGPCEIKNLRTVLETVVIIDGKIEGMDLRAHSSIKDKDALVKHVLE